MNDAAQSRWAGEHLVLAARGGDEDALATLIEAAHPHVRRFASAMCSTETDAEDAAQEALVVLYQRIGTLRTVGALTSWVFTVVKNECLRLARHRLRRLPLDYDELAHSAETDALRRLEVEHIAGVIAALPDDQRQVLVMRDVYGRSGREVARVLGISTAAMKSRLHRARTAVRTALTAEGHI